MLIALFAFFGIAWVAQLLVHFPGNFSDDKKRAQYLLTPIGLLTKTKTEAWLGPESLSTEYFLKELFSGKELANSVTYQDTFPNGLVLEKHVFFATYLWFWKNTYAAELEQISIKINAHDTATLTIAFYDRSYLGIDSCEYSLDTIGPDYRASQLACMDEDPKNRITKEEALRVINEWKK